MFKVYKGNSVEEKVDEKENEKSKMKGECEIEGEWKKEREVGGEK